MRNLITKLPSILNNPDIKRLFAWFAVTALSPITIVTIISAAVLFTDWLKRH